MFQYFSSFFIFILTCSKLWSISEHINFQDEPLIKLSDTIVYLCPNDKAIIYVSISGQLPISVTYSAIINGKPVERIVESNISPLKIKPSKAGDYTITSYSNRHISVNSNISFKVIPAKLPDAELSGGGVFCENEEIEPIQVQFKGIAPWKLTYQINDGNAIKEIFTADFSILRSEKGKINLLHISDAKCSTTLLKTASIKLFKTPKTNFLSGKQELCPGDLALYKTNYSRKYEYNWLIPKGGNIKHNSSQRPNELSVLWNLPGEFNIELIVRIPNTGCSTGLISYPVKVFSPPLTKKNKDTIACLETGNHLLLVPSDVKENTIYWPHLNRASFSAEIYEEGIYDYIETSPLGCSDTGSIRVIDKCISEIFVPEAFTPNDDNINDKLEVFGAFYNLEFNIYNLNGELIFKSQNENHFWDGKRDGYSMPNGTYLWKASYTDENQHRFTKEGHVILIR